ncbi:unnamed protein product (macronuclear) [Paramecium tetraurelia]|uniref:Uncharacterized protein n=1 Tax=Paramecium tetraurelia TaxID=5888 RepID=A0E5D0_PARTE|nr:uncharacterized protein GSPATT00023674001 [Paramecium tetraurelia]CAK90497.1 unnamed protein product [Paramecium tetraurelia]|eukprot:XP_001457894.1 hypothetical protein (macronuclear) [Paramecium tetraurelia strain d4-2]
MDSQFESFPIQDNQQDIQEMILRQLQQQAFTNYISSTQTKERILLNENSRLKEDNQKLQEKANMLEIKQEELVNEIQDLRLLVKRVYNEGEIHAEKLRMKNMELVQQNETLSKGLENLQKNMESFSSIKQISEFYENVGELEDVYQDNN